MSTRALQRVLRDNGTSFRQLLADVRNEYARAYLSSTSFSNTEVAFLLGFEDESSFARAFRGWNGVTPAMFRRRAAAGG
jgi:AraC-like DNA-binding protein